MTIHAEHPFLEPPDRRRALRRLRGRWPAGVSVWTAHGRRPVGLTISSMLIADGDPGGVVGLVDPDSELMDAITDTGGFTVSVLARGHDRLADAFAGLTPAPGGPFTLGTWQEHEYGPWLVGSIAALSVRVDETSAVSGWSRLVAGTISEVLSPLDETAEPLAHLRGRYGTVDTD
ncbi:flavin reductase family protein [Propionibacteriaceae bacterium Y1700]|uniref:flavin reductase family protein n=1 Tax=Microlunatus sp. Y1700 TaxID=3418487 RepID=UPI003DA73DC2